MRSNARRVALALVALLALLTGFALYRGRPRTNPAVPSVVLVAPTPPADASFKVMLAGHQIMAVLPREARGARLRERGEALGDRTPVRVETSTDTVY